MRLITITRPIYEPVTLSEAKDHLRVDTSDDDTLIESKIVSAREWCEAYCRRSFARKTLELQIAAFSDLIELPEPELVSVTSIKYLDADLAEQTVATTVYRVIGSGEVHPGAIMRLRDQSWPTTYLAPDAVRIRYVAGPAHAGSPASTLDESIKDAIKLLVGELYENRESSITGTIVAQLPTLQRLLDPHRVY